MRLLVKKFFNTFGFEVSRLAKTDFSVNGIRYTADAHSIGHTVYGEITGQVAAERIQQFGLKQLNVLDICCGVGLVGLTMYSYLKDEPSTLSDIAFADINIFNVNSLKKTLKLNGLYNHRDFHFPIYLSDGLTGIPKNQQFDLIVSNPPYYPGERFTDDKLPLTPARLGTYDGGWDFHKSFYSQCHEYLTDRGEIWFLENASVAGEKEFVPFIESNPHLKYVEGTKCKIDVPVAGDLLLMVTKKV